MKPLLFSNCLPILLAAVLAGAPALQAQAQALPTSNVDSIVAVVNEGVILRSELDLAITNITAQLAAQQAGSQLPPREVLEKQVLERLIMQRLQVDRAADSGIRVSDEELQQAVAQVASQNKMTVDQLRARLPADGL